MTLQPHGSRVLIRPDSEGSNSKIVIPEKFQKAADRGTVVSVGAGRRRMDGTMCPLAAKPGDRVIFSLVQIMRLEHEGEKLAVMDEDAILVFLIPDSEASDSRCDEFNKQMQAKKEAYHVEMEKLGLKTIK